MTKKVLFLSGSLLVVLLIVLGTIPVTVLAKVGVLPPAPVVDEPATKPMEPAPPPPDARLNKLNSLCAVYADEQGIRILGINSAGQGVLAVEVKSDQLDHFASAQNEAGTMSIFQLAGGGFQANCGPDADGKVFVTYFDAAPPTTICGYEFNVNDPNLTLTQTMTCGPSLMERYYK